MALGVGPYYFSASVCWVRLRAWFVFVGVCIGVRRLLSQLSFWWGSWG